MIWTQRFPYHTWQTLRASQEEEPCVILTHTLCGLDNKHFLLFTPPACTLSLTHHLLLTDSPLSLHTSLSCTSPLLCTLSFSAKASCQPNILPAQHLVSPTSVYTNPIPERLFPHPGYLSLLERSPLETCVYKLFPFL